MRTLALAIAMLGCSSSKVPAPHDAPKAIAAAADAPVAAAPDATAAARPAATEIQPVEMAGPFPSLADSCKAAPPCGFTDMDDKGNETKPATKPRCDAVIDPQTDIVSNVPDGMTKHGDKTQMTHNSGDVEIRLGGVVCEVPKGIRRDHSMYYVFMHRSDGWWRTAKSMFEFDYNDKYCGGAMYVIWNDKPTRTIAGIAAQSVCMACNKQGQQSSLAELMLRVETTGAKPAVFPLLPVGERNKLEAVGDPADSPDCKPSSSSVSLKETWPADDEVVLDGKAGPNVKTGEALTLDQFVGDATIKPGRYRFSH
jgi:hypothetical protein